MAGPPFLQRLELDGREGETRLPARRLGVLEESLAEILVREKLPQRPFHRLLSHRRPPRSRLAAASPNGKHRARLVESEESQEFQALRPGNRPARPLIASLFACSIPRSVAWNPTPRRLVGSPDILWVEVLRDHDG